MKEPEPSAAWRAARARARRENGEPRDTRSLRVQRAVARFADETPDSPNLAAVRSSDPAAAVYAAQRTYIELLDSGLLGDVVRATLRADFDRAVKLARGRGIRLASSNWPPTIGDLAAWDERRGTTTRGLGA